MKEQTYYHELIQERIVNDAMVKAVVMQSVAPKTFRWKRALSVAALCLMLAVATVLAIPTTRAEVFGWLGIATPVDMLMTDPAERPTTPEWNALITPIDPNASNVKPIPIDRTDSKAVNSEAALKLSDFLYENCDIALGDALFDGESIYQSIHLNGLSGLYLWEEWVGGNAASVPVDPEAMRGIYGDMLTEEELSYERTLYEHPIGRIRYVLDDGTTYGGALDLSIDATENYRQMLKASGLERGATDGAQADAINQKNRAYLLDNGVVAVAEITPDMWERHVDANGLLTVHVYYSVAVCEAERGDGTCVPDTELFWADCGTITIDMHAWETIPKRSAYAPEKVVLWGTETVTIGRTQWQSSDMNTGTENTVAYARYQLDMRDVSWSAEPECCTIDALGIHEIRIRIRLPKSWSDEERTMFLDALFLQVLIDGEAGPWLPNRLNRTLDPDGTVLLRIPSMEGVPYARLSDIQSISCIPILVSYTAVTAVSASGETERLQPRIGETAVSKTGVVDAIIDTTETAYPQAAVTLFVNNE